jgi:TolA-binding protein
VTPATPGSAAKKSPTGTTRPGARKTPAGKTVTPTPAPGPTPTPPAPEPVPEVDPVEQVVSAATADINAGRFDQALSNLQGALGQKPDSRFAPQANLLIARIYDRQHKVDQAIAAYTGVRNRYPTNPVTAEALFRSAELVQETKQSDRLQVARRYLDRLVTDFPNSPITPRALAWRAGIEDRENTRVTDPTLGRPVPASLVSYRLLTDRYPSSSFAEDAFWKLSTQYQDLKRFDLAAQALEQLGTHFPNSRYDAWWEAGELYQKKVKDDTRAKNAYSKVPLTSRRYKDAQKKIK